MRPLALAALCIGSFACQGPHPPMAPDRVTPPPHAAIPLPALATGSRALLVEKPGGLGLFRDEAADAKERIAAWASAQGHEVVPIDHAERILTLAAAGKSLDGQICGLPLSRWYAQERYAADLGASGALRSWVHCPRADHADGANGQQGQATDEPTGSAPDDDEATQGAEAADPAAPSSTEPPSSGAQSEGDDSDESARADGGPEAPACTLRVDVLDALGVSGKIVSRYRAPIDLSKDWRAALTEALPKLTIHQAQAQGGMGVLGVLSGSLSGSTTVTAEPEKLGWSAWPARKTDELANRSFEDALSFPGGNAPLRACFGSSTGEELLIAVNEAGRVTRCESRNAEDAAARCACAAFTQHARATGELIGRRAYVGVSFSPADVVTPTNLVVDATASTHLERYEDDDGEVRFRPVVTDRSIDGWKPPSGPAMASCFAQRTAEGRHALSFVIVFDDYGHAREVTLDEKRSAPIAPAELTCMKQRLMKSRAPCPASPQTSARVRVSLSLRLVGSKRPGLDDLLKGDLLKGDLLKKAPEQDDAGGVKPR